MSFDHINRRQWLRLLPATTGVVAMSARSKAVDAVPLVRASDVLRFPEDFGAHPAYRTEWWYITGSLQGVGPAGTRAQSLGFQITFFRSRVDSAQASQSRFAVRQLVLAHAALTDLSQGRMLHDQRVARAGFGLADAALGDTDLTLRDWHLKRQGPVQASLYSSHVAARDFTLTLELKQTQPLLLQGKAGFSQKGPDPRHASHYYSQPQLAVQGRIRHQQQDLAVRGLAWLDHEWGERLLAPEVVGWDWIGMNFHDGRALTAFRVRRQDGSAYWHGGSLRSPGQPPRNLQAHELRFTPQRWWTSPASGARYPVQWQLDVAGERFTVRARLDPQELDGRASTGNIYWEGLSDLLDAGGKVVGSGYLEMTGYASAMVL